MSGYDKKGLPMPLLRLDVEGKDLSPSEERVIRLIALGYTQTSAALRLGKSYETVRRQTKMARAKLGAKTNAQAVAIAISLDLI